MKFMSKNSRFAKILAIAFSLLMLITATDLPIFVGVVASAADKFTVIVKEKADSSVAVEGATVTVTPAESTGLAEQTGTTDEDGKVEFDVFTEYFNNSGEAFEAEYKVTADNYVSVEETVTVTAEGFSVELEKVSITGISLVPCNVKFKGDGASYAAVKVNGTIDGDVVSFSTDGEIFSESQVMLTYPSDSKKVWVKVERAGHKDFIDSVDAVMAKGDLVEGDDIFVSPLNDKYTGSAQKVASVTRNPEKDITIEYSGDGGVTYHTITNENPVPDSITEPGTKTFKIRATAEHYNVFEKEYTARVARADIESDKYEVVVYGGAEGATYNGKCNYAVKVTVAEGFTALYSTDGSNYTEYVPTVCDAGEYKVYVKLVHKDDYYNELDLGAFDVTVNKAPITGVNVKPFEGVYRPNMSEPAVQVTGAEKSEITYFVNGIAFSDVPTVTSVEDAGTYTVKIDKGANYEVLELNVEVKVEKADLSLTIEGDDVITYKEDNKFTPVVKMFITGDDGAKEEIRNDEVVDNLVFSIEKCDDAAMAEIDTETGCVTYYSVGTIVIKATYNADTLVNYNFDYKNGAAVLKTQIVYVDTPEYTVTPAEYVDESIENKVNWHKGNVEIYEASEKWEIIEDSNALGQEGWKDSVSRTEEGLYLGENAVKVAFRNKETKEITQMETVAAFAIDKTAPVVEEFEISLWERSVNKVINFLTFGIFANDNVTVKVYVSDAEPASGVDSVTLYINGEEVETSDKLDVDEKGIYAKFNIPEEQIAENSKYVAMISASAKDNLGQMSDTPTAVNDENSNIGSGKSGLLMIETIKPVISDITYSPMGNYYEIKEDDKVIERYYDDDVEFSFSVTDSDSGVKEVYATINGVPVVKKSVLDDGSERLVKYDFTVSTEGLEATDDGEYKLSIVATDFAGNAFETETSVYVDKTAPVITDISFSKDEEGKKEIKNEDLVKVESEAEEEIVADGEVTDDEAAVEEEFEVTDIDNFGFYSNGNVYAHITAQDFVSDKELVAGLKSITYIIVNLDNPEDVETVTKPVSGEKATVTAAITKDMRFQIYAYATDLLENNLPDGDKAYTAGEEFYDPADYNTDYAGTIEYEGCVYPNAVIIESAGTHNNPAQNGDNGNHITLTVPDTSYKQNDGTPLYAGNVTVTVNVVDNFSGIRDIKVTAVAPFDTEKNYENTVTVPNSGVSKGDSLGKWKVTKVGPRNLVTAMSAKFNVQNNSNDIKFMVEMTDRAGNTSTEFVVFGIDKTKPEISISYAPGEVHDEQYVDYFRTDRVATITITERNFRAENVEFKFTNTDGVIPNVNLSDPKNWTTHKVGKNVNPDNTTHTATVKFTADGDYTFDLSCIDNAANKSNDVAEQKFTIDKTLPLISVVYDNNSARNGNYYNDKRIATVTITEHNFDKSRVQFSIFSENKSPAISGWRSNGDVHTATISYTEDSRYTFDVAFRDMAGNSIADFAQQEFHVDTTAPEVTLKGIVDKSANADKGNIGFELTATDKNFDTFEPTVKAILYKNGSFKTETVKIGATTTITNGKKYNVVNITDDGIYSVTCTVVDKAGNTYSKVYLQNKNGDLSLQSRTQASPLVTFTVNREGSVFYLDNYTKGLVKDYYVKDVTDFVTIVEINADPIIENTITINGKKLVKDTDYTVSSNNDSSSWYKYTYKIDKEVFAAEGDYNVIVSTKDKAENDAFSDIKDTEVKFVVDRTAPIVTVAGLESNGKYKTDLQQVLLIPSDNGGLLKSVIVRTVDENGSVLKEIINLTGDQLDEAIAAGQISFNLEEGVRQHVQIICEDYAGNISGSEEEEKFTNITVSTNAFVIFWATEWLRWTTIIIATLLIALIVFVIVKKRKKA